MRVCKVCQIEKEVSAFDPHRYTCKSCRCLYKHNRYLQKKITSPIKQRKKRTKQSIDQIKQKRKEYYQKNKERILADREKYRKENPDKVLQSARKHRKKYLSKFQEYDRIYRLLHKEKRRIQNRESEKRRILRDPAFKIRKNLSNSIYCALIRNKSTKNNLSILKYLPYTIQELKQHLENKFESWMNWNNWGVYDPKTWNDQDSTTWTWQIDHIIPHSLFCYNSMEDQQFHECWALKNLRPYSAKNNCMENVPEKRIKNDMHDL